jgi:O-antigen/teichoic acid export membrane protein
MLRSFLKNKFVKDSFVYTVGILIGGFLGYIFQFIVSRKLAVAQYGEFQSLMSSSAIFGVVSSAVSYFVIKYTAVFAREKDFASNNSFLKTLNVKLRWLALFFVVLFFLAMPLLHNYLRLTDYWGLIFVGVTLFIGLISTTYGAVLSGWQMFAIASGVVVVAGVLKLFAGVVGTRVAPTSTGIVFFLLIVAEITWLINYAIVREKFYKKSAANIANEWKQKYFSNIDIGRSVILITIFSFAVALIQNIDVLLVKNLTNAEITGYYSVLNLLGKIIFWVNGAILAVVLPAACASGLDGRRPSRKLVLSAYGLIGFVSFCGILIYFVAPNFIITLLFGAKYLLFADSLWLFGLIAFWLSVLTLEANFAYARHDFRISYILGSVVLLMIFCTHFFHATIREVALAINVAMAIGFFAALILNNCQSELVVKNDREA